jgi:hypothetical protein
LFLRNSIELAVEKVGMSKDLPEGGKQLESGVSFVIDLIWMRAVMSSFVKR